MFHKPMSTGADLVETNSKCSDPQLTVDAKRLAKMLNLGLRTIRSYDVAGKLPSPIRIGSRVLWRVDEIRKWVNAGAPDRETWERINAARR